MFLGLHGRNKERKLWWPGHYLDEIAVFRDEDIARKVAEKHLIHSEDAYEIVPVPES